MFFGVAPVNISNRCWPNISWTHKNVHFLYAQYQDPEHIDSY